MVRILGCWQRWVNEGIVYGREILVGWNPTYVVGYRGGEICEGKCLESRDSQVPDIELIK